MKVLVDGNIGLHTVGGTHGRNSSSSSSSGSSNSSSSNSSRTKGERGRENVRLVGEAIEELECKCQSQPGDMCNLCVCVCQEVRRLL